MRIAASIELSEEDREMLRRLSSSRSISVGLHQRVRIVLMAAEGKTNKDICAELGISHPTVSLWRKRFAAEGLKGIEKERPRGGNHGGKNSEEQAKLRSRIIEATTQTEPEGYALVMPQHGQGHGHYAQFRKQGMEGAWAEAPPDKDVQAQQ